MTDNTNIEELKRRMDGAIKSLQHEFSGLRTGRASASMLETVQVSAYGSTMPINQVGNISVPEPRMLSIQVWDRGMVSAVDKAIREANLGLNPMVDGTLIRIPVPDLSEERRKELVKVAHKYAENTKVSVRNIRRDGMDALKKAEKDGDISEDDHRKMSDEVQKATDKFIAQVDTMLAAKEKDILSL